MKCTLVGNNARVFAKAVQSLSKIGVDLFLEAEDQGLLLRSINSTHSAVGSIRFKCSFFHSYTIKPDNENYCKISMKACLSVFRNMRHVERCELCIFPGQTKFQIQLKCRLETVKNALLSIVDEENITAAVSPDNTSNVISGSHKIFSEISSNFNSVEEEITLETQVDFCGVKNYVEGSRVNDKFMRSQLKLKSAEFDLYKIEKETTVTFCLKEFKAFLLFAESLNENMVLNFDESGSPIFISIKQSDYLECTLVMSTLAPDDVSFYDDCRSSDVTVRNNTNSCQPPKRKLRNTSTNSKSRSKSKKHIADDTTLSNESSVFQFNGGSESDVQSLHAPRIISENLVLNELQFPTNSVPSIAVTPVVPEHSELSVTFCETEDNREQQVEECIPPSPPRKERMPKLRSIFSRCFDSTYVPKEPSPNSQDYVANSDADD